MSNMVGYNKQALLSLHEHLGSYSVFGPCCSCFLCCICLFSLPSFCVLYPMLPVSLN